MPNVVRELNPSAAYVFCPHCRANGTPNSMLHRELHLFKCSLGHSFQSWGELERFSPDMTPASEIMQEQPNPQAMKWPIYVMPKTREAIENKFPGRVHTTIGTMLDMLADDSVLILQGSEVKELRKRGIKNGAEAIAALDGLVNLQKERDQAVEQLAMLQRALKSAGVE